MKILSVAWKDVQILLKDRGTLIVSFLLPFVFILAFSLPELAGEAEAELVALPVVSLDGGSQASQELVGALNAAGGLRVDLYEAEYARELLANGDIHWLLEVPPDFGEMSLEHPVALRLVVHPDADAVQVDSISLVINGVAKDMALKSQLLASFEQLSAMMDAGPEEFRVFTTETYMVQAESQFERSKGTPLVAVEQKLPALKEEEPVAFNNSNITVPGFTVLFVFLTAQVTAQSIFQEKRLGSFRRLLAAPIGKGELLAGKMLPNLVVTLLQIIVVFGVAMIVLPLLGLERLTLGSDPIALILVSLLVALCSTSVGVLIAAIASSEAQAGALGSVVLWVMAAVGGSFIPTFLMGGALKTLSAVVPHSWALRAYHNLLVYGRGLVDVLPEMAALLGFTVVFLAIGLWRFDFE